MTVSAETRARVVREAINTLQSSDLTEVSDAGLQQIHALVKGVAEHPTFPDRLKEYGGDEYETLKAGVIANLVAFVLAAEMDPEILKDFARSFLWQTFSDSWEVTNEHSPQWEHDAG